MNNVPPPPVGLAYIEVATSGYHSLGRLSDESVAAWGLNSNGVCDVPALPPGLTYVELAATALSSMSPTFAVSMLRRSDGSVVAAGTGYPYGQSAVPDLPPGYSYVEIAARPALSFARFQPTAPASTPATTLITPGPGDALGP
ncbi:MAG TPA: RCC1 domain-containing protein [Planctomycetota bacterium]|nr:RCC1 domain-containing protein [Planctomycetota bacterium]